MTNDNNTRKKANAVFFSAIMVLSMVAIGFAAMPAAAQANDHDSFTYSPENPWQGQDVTADVDNPDAEYQLRRVTDTDDGGVTTSSQFISDVTADGTGDVVIETDDLDAGNYFISGNGLDRRPAEENTFEVRIQNLDADFDDDSVADAGGDSATDLEIDSNRGSYSLNVSADGDLDEEELLEVFVDQNVLDGALIDLHQTDTIRDAITFDDDGNPLVGGAEPADVTDQQYADLIVDALNDENNFNANEREAVADAFDNLDYDETPDEVSVTDAGDFMDEFADVNPFFAFSFDTAEDDADEQIVLINIGDREEEVDFAGIDDGEYEFLFEVSDTAAEATATITVDDIDDAALEFVDSTVNVAQGGVASVTVEANDAADSGVLIIGEEDDYGYQMNVTIEDFNDDDQITIYFNTYTAGTTGLADAGVEDDDVVWVEDDLDEGAAITFDAAGGDAGGEMTPDLEFILSQGDYDMSVLAANDYEDAVDNPDDIGSLIIDERQEPEMNIWTASSDTVDDISDVDDVVAGVEAGNITERDLVAHDDYLIHDLGADSGLDGVFQYIARNNDVSIEDLVGETTNDNLFTVVNDGDGENERAARLRIRETRDSAGPNTERRQVQPENLDDLEIVSTAGVSSVYLAADTDSWNSGNNHPFQSSELDDESDYEFNTNFRVEDNWLLEFDEDDDGDLADFFETADSTYDVEERTGEFAEDPYNVTATEDVELTAMTNIAPGSEVNMRVRSSGDTRPSFIMTESDLEVTQNEDVTGTFDFSDTNTGDTFDLSLRSGGFPSDVDADGNVVEMEEEETETPEETPEETEEPETEEPETEEPETEEPETEEPETEEPTDDDTPGFGAVVALVALIAAALLATRRRP